MATSVELEVQKEKIRKLPASPKRGDMVYEALRVWIPLQTDEDWLRLINVKSKKLNQREIAAELCATDNIWKRERFRILLDEMNDDVIEKGLLNKTIDPSVRSDSEIPLKPEAVTNTENPMKQLEEAKLKAKLLLTEGKLQQANLRIRKLEAELKKYTELSELNRALEQLTRPRR
ncbi:MULTISPECIES: hypothetical protein [Vibrio]|uniref:hypothetical protein n=1 Tax=Vibrio TaxID=662 RepID=UPI00186A5B45|nr:MULTISPECIES: hypothetical protein [Vibrio]MBE4128688.1 hypothetical protein [Vibrio parahaemolyticus]MBN8112534.1 hypothetical protein [Vibrio vulnificus]MCZ5870116.1 hypothetical protein [Vibrio parahaemolyticus]MCZ5900456.1 hypothetical protein [Vibrio parahaemolyticus]MCZ6023382.1 hypothetical protein [Vibrio parahaemolyticus]